VTRIAVIGPGAVGVTFGGAAERAGHDVALYGRVSGPAPTLELTDGSEHVLRRPVATVPGTPAPWVLLAVKTHQTEGAAPLLAALAGEDGVVVALQNGVEHRALVAPHADGAHVLPAIVWCPSERVDATRTVQRGPARLSVPDEPAGRELAALLAPAAQVDPVPDFRTEAWRKLLLNATAAVMVIAGRRAEVFREPAQLAIARGLAEECVAVGRAEGAALGRDDVDAVLAQLTQMPPDLGTSMLFDRLAGRRLEWQARNGVVGRLGAGHGIPTPVTDEVCARLAALDPVG
jgi:2-dehydropantoate 2-reductase